MVSDANIRTPTRLGIPTNAMRTLYFDTAAITPVDPEVIEDVIDVLHQVPGNPSSTTHPQVGTWARHVETVSA
jgi:cysteine desulfurase